MNHAPSGPVARVQSNIDLQSKNSGGSSLQGGFVEMLRTKAVFPSWTTREK
jgi:hypothetical protein